MSTELTADRLKEEAQRMGFRLVPVVESSVLKLKEFAGLIGMPVETFRDHLQDFEHFRIKGPGRIKRYHREKVLNAIARGDLTKRAA